MPRPRCCFWPRLVYHVQGVEFVKIRGMLKTWLRTKPKQMLGISIREIQQNLAGSILKARTEVVALGGTTHVPWPYVKVVIVEVVIVEPGQNQLPTSRDQLITSVQQRLVYNHPGYDHLYVVLSAREKCRGRMTAQACVPLRACARRYVCLKVAYACMSVRLYVCIRKHK